MNKQVLITGGSGLVGRYLSKFLIERGYKVAHLGRASTAPGAYKRYTWDLSSGYIDSEAITTSHYVIHLAGAGVEAHRWTATYKKELVDSRIRSTQLLGEAIKRYNPSGIQKVVSTSAIGIYGNQSPLFVAEDAPAANTFLAKLCTDWENEAWTLQSNGIPVSIIRTGIVWAKDGGFIPKISLPIKLYAGTVLGSGLQYLSWIHIHDLCEMYYTLMLDSESGEVYNGVSPDPQTQLRITQLMAKQLKRPLLLPHLPVWAMKILFGEMHTMLVASQHVSAQKWLDRGFQFQFAETSRALQDLLP